MANDTCPHCGAERSGLTSDGRFACGTLGGSRSPFCYSQQLATVTAERDEMKKQKELDDYHILKLQCVLEGSTKRNRHKRETIKTLQDQVDELRRRIDEAPVGYVLQNSSGECLASRIDEDDAYALRERSPLAEDIDVVRVRLVRDDQPTEGAPESSPHSL